MFDKAKKEWKKEVNSYKKERKSKLYNGWDIGDSGSYDVKKDGVTYHCYRPSKLVVDAYDPLIGSVELSHHESAGYAVVEGYEGDTDTLDFTFIKPQDEVHVECDDKIKEIRLNATCLRYINIKSKQPVHISIVKDTGPIDRKLGEKIFKENHQGIIKDISYIDKDELNSMLSDTESKSEEEKGNSK